MPRGVEQARGVEQVNTVTMSEDDQYRAESDLRTLQECEKIEKDPKRMKAGRELAKKQLEELKAIADGTEE
jgi:hypothetical protein